MRWNYFVLPLCLISFACASSTPRESEKPVAAQSAEAAPAAKTDAAKAESTKTTPEGAVAQNDDNKPICKMEQVIGSNMRKRVCRSKEQMEREKREAQDMARRASRGGPANAQ